MKLLQRTFLFLSMFSLCYSQENQDPVTTMTTTKQSTPIVTTSSSPSLSTAISVTVQTSVNTPEKLETTVATEKVTSSIRISSSSLTLSTSNGTLEEQSTMPMISTKSSLSSAVAKTEKETPRSESPSNVSSTTNPPGSDQFRSTMSTTQSIQKSNHILTSPTKKSGVILPVVIALIAITLSVFTLVGLYRICWKTDPGTPDNGTDQPQSDKESVKLLTVKTISPETSEQSSQGKNKN
ncbi:endomucin isoform X2 [Petaurus breviceps papuanus]|uniref:endomucin isoform X2 n=1 Tax=Petaurus breviceps papuanus TaxID=3040969 RepID=UPI0036D8888E